MSLTHPFLLNHKLETDWTGRKSKESFRADFSSQLLWKSYYTILLFFLSQCVFVLFFCACVCGRTGSALSLLYGTSATLEHHHFNHAVMILQSEVCYVPISAAMQLPFTFCCMWLQTLLAIEPLTFVPFGDGIFLNCSLQLQFHPHSFSRNWTLWLLLHNCCRRLL